MQGAPGTPDTPGQDPNGTPYDFFMNPQPQKNNISLGNLFGNKKVIIFAAVVVVLLLLIVVLSAGGGKQAPTPLLSVAQAQQEIIRVSADGAKNAQSTDLKNFAVTTGLSLSSDQRILLSYMGAHGAKPKTKDLSLTQNPQTDQALAAAAAANTYDTTFSATMQHELDDYQNKLETASSTATLKSEQALLKRESDNAALLRKQLGQ